MYRTTKFCGVLLAIGCVTSSAIADERGAFFETHVRPVLVEHCIECHGPDEQASELRLDSREAMLAGGERGPAMVPGESSRSLLMRAIRHQGDLAMPPEVSLGDPQIAAFEHWINEGGEWPEDAALEAAARQEQATSHWAFQPVRRPELPSLSELTDAQRTWAQSPIDRFILQRLHATGLRPAPEADRATLIRRVSYVLTGLPPTADEVAAFVADEDPSAYERLVDHLLESPHFGEHWARHWLDIARYSDTKGYVYAREERFWVHGWVYRDWVVDALNRDLPYDRFLLLQLAADQVPDAHPNDLAAMGFLTLGRRFLGVKHDVIDDRIDVVSRGTMALTMACARCHDHKYDPIPTSDYYALYGVFDSCAEHQVDLLPSGGDAEFYNGLEERRRKLAQKSAEYSQQAAERVRSRLYDYLFAQTELEKYPAEGFDQILQPGDLYPAYVRRWESYLRKALRERDPVFAAWHAYQGLSAAEFAESAVAVTRKMQASDANEHNPYVLLQFKNPPASFVEVVRRYADLLADVDRQWHECLEQKRAAGEPAPDRFVDDAALEQLRAVLYGPYAPCSVPEGTIVTTETFFPTNQCEELWRLQGDIDRWIIGAGDRVQFAVALVDRDEPQEPRIFLRGNAARKGRDVVRRVPQLLSHRDAGAFQQGSGRLELAQAIVAPDNPLTSRVIVNRVWGWVFGEGLVGTTSDFGTRADPPSHPELLDWLATQLIDDGWSLKRTIRTMLLSSAFRQASERQVAAHDRMVARQRDPANRLLWSAKRHRLTFEETRDTILVATGELQRRLGGKPQDMFATPFMTRRAIYGLVDRQYLPSTLRTFDFANPDLHTPQRSETTVPQQSLFFMNHKFILAQARLLADETELAESPSARVTEMFRRVLLRHPTERELQETLAWIALAEPGSEASIRQTAADWKYGYGAWQASEERVTGFQELPHFAGNAWQGGANYPDDQLGWVQLTANGGHPGNDVQHAAIRRWVAPRAMTVTVDSRLEQRSQPGDGIRAFVVSSRGGLLASAAIHQEEVALRVAARHVEIGETVDFVVDIGEILNSDEFRWRVTIAEQAPKDRRSEVLVWDSEADFTPNETLRLSAWGRLAQILLCTNEMSFVD